MLSLNRVFCFLRAEFSHFTLSPLTKKHNFLWNCVGMKNKSGHHMQETGCVLHIIWSQWVPRPVQGLGSNCLWKTASPYFWGRFQLDHLWGTHLDNPQMTNCKSKGKEWQKVVLIENKQTKKTVDLSKLQQGIFIFFTF